MKRNNFISDPLTRTSRNKKLHLFTLLLVSSQTKFPDVFLKYPFTTKGKELHSRMGHAFISFIKPDYPIDET